MQTIQIPTRDQLSPENQAMLDKLQKTLGFVPNLYATFALSEHALGNYLAFQNARSTITGRAREVVNLVVSQVNGCQYCLAAHTAIGAIVGFSPDQILEIRRGTASFDLKLDALARLVRAIAVERGHASLDLREAFFAVGWTQENLVDTLLAVGDKVVSNYLHAMTQVPVDFPAAPAI